MRKISVVALAALTLVALSTGLAQSAGKFNKVLAVGDKAPAWSDLPGTDENKHSLDGYKDAKVVVQIFTCNHCPVAKAYEDRLVALQDDYKDKGVQLVAINCNNTDAERIEAMKERALSKGFNFAYLHDQSQESARAYGARVTPEVFVLDGDRKIVYMGAIDDNWQDPSAVKKSHLRNAIDAVLAGRTPDVQETRAEGCGIKYE